MLQVKIFSGERMLRLLGHISTFEHASLSNRVMGDRAVGRFLFSYEAEHSLHWLRSFFLLPDCTT